MSSFSPHHETTYKNRWLYFTVTQDTYEESDEYGKYYAEIFDRAGKDVALTESLDTFVEARTAAMTKIRELEAKAKELRPSL